MIGTGSPDIVPSDAPLASRQSRASARARQIWARFCRNRLALLGLGLFLMMVVLALAAPLVTNFGPFTIVGDRLRPPSEQFPFGTDQAGRDIFTGVLYGTRTSLMVGLLSVLISVSIGVSVGALSGYYRGRVDDLLIAPRRSFQVDAAIHPGTRDRRYFRRKHLGDHFCHRRFELGGNRAVSASRIPHDPRTSIRRCGPRLWRVGFPDHRQRNSAERIDAGHRCRIASNGERGAVGGWPRLFGVGDPTVISFGTMLNSAQQSCAMRGGPRCVRALQFVL